MVASMEADRGLFLRGRRWYLRAYVAGHGKKVFALKPDGAAQATTNKATARIIARKIRQGIKDQTRRAPEDFDALKEQFGRVAALTGKAKQQRHNKAVVDQFCEAQGISSPSQITTAAIQDYLTALQADGKAPATLRNYKVALSRFCEFLRPRGALNHNPTRGVKCPKIEKSLPVYLSPQETEEALLLAREHGIYGEVAVAIYTGLRCSELRSLEWSHIDYKARTLLVPKSKSRRPRTVPLSKQAIAALREQEALTGGGKYVFPGGDHADAEGRRQRWWWEDAIKPLQASMAAFKQRDKGQVGRGWHLLRHTFASRLVQAGVSIYKVSEWLGHSDVKTTQMYSHLQPGYDPEIEKLHGGESE